MNNKIQNLLEKCPVSIKWKNFNTWQKQEINNLYEACKAYRITFKKSRKYKDMMVITLDHGTFKIQHLCTMGDLERYLITVIGMRLYWLGDKTKLTTRFGTDTIN